MGGKGLNLKMDVQILFAFTKAIYSHTYRNCLPFERKLQLTMMSLTLEQSLLLEEHAESLESKNHFNLKTPLAEPGPV